MTDKNVDLLDDENEDDMENDVVFRTREAIEVRELEKRVLKMEEALTELVKINGMRIPIALHEIAFSMKKRRG